MAWINALEEKMDTRIDALEQKMDTKIDGVDQKVEKIDSRFESLRYQVDSTKIWFAWFTGAQIVIILSAMGVFLNSVG